MGAAVRQSWIWHFDQPVAAMWPLLADTARFNEAAGLPKHQIEEVPQSDGSVAFFASARFGPLTVGWRERPVNWVTNQWFEHCRDFRSGPFRTLCASLFLEPEGTGSRGTYVLEVEPANLVGRAMLATGRFHASARKTFTKLAEEARDYVAGEASRPLSFAPSAPSREVARRVEALVAAIEQTPYAHGLARRLADLVLHGQEVDVTRIRPRLLARAWAVPERAAIELCLQAVKSGLLQLRWDLLCPRCLGAKAWSGSLDRLPEGAHCSSCNVDYARDFSQNVEASFRPAPGIRALEGGEFCLFGPMSTPHVKVQIALAPGEQRSVTAELPEADYRLRTVEIGDALAVTASTAAFPEVVLQDSGGIMTGPVAPPGTLLLSNRSSSPRTLVIEDWTWRRDVLTADRLTTLQAFRDLFAAEVLRPGDDVGIAAVTLMFTDLKGSTALYESIGDAKAYRLVREHFAFLAEQVREHDGAVIKTIGDAVMAAFADPAGALRAALAIQEKVSAFNAAQPGPAIAIKLGLHRGPCIAVTLNNRLDYFGSTVNLAARLQGESEGGDIVLSQALAQDPIAAALLAPFPLVADEAVVKGFERPISFFRLRPDTAPAAAAR